VRVCRDERNAKLYFLGFLLHAVEFDALVAAGFVLNSLKLASGYSGYFV